MHQSREPHSLLQEGNTKENYEVKQKSLKGISKAKKQAAAMKEHMDKLQAERKSRDKTHTSALSTLMISPDKKKAATGSLTGSL